MGKHNKGAALLQVLLVTVLLAGMATMVLRISLSRSSASRQTRHDVIQELLVESCMAEVNMMWNTKTPEAFERDLAGCWMNCSTAVSSDTNWKNTKNYTSSSCYSSTDGINTTNATRYYTCTSTADLPTVYAIMSRVASGSDEGKCKISYALSDAEITSRL